MSENSKPQFKLYTGNSPNGVKASIALEELGLKYEVYEVDLLKGEQREPWFLEINPNGRIPALTDRGFGDRKEELHVFESGAILQYLVDTYDTEHRISYPRGTREYWRMMSWVYFQMAGVGPMQGQANHFFRYCPEKYPYAINRYQTETARLYGVLNTQLSATPFLVGDKMTIADIASYPWVRVARWSGVDTVPFPALQRWVERVEEREAVMRGFVVPTPRMLQLLKDPEEAERAVERVRATSNFGGTGEKGQEKEKEKEKDGE